MEEEKKEIEEELKPQSDEKVEEVEEKTVQEEVVEEEETQAGTQPAPEGEEGEKPKEEVEKQEAPKEKMIPQSEVNRILQKRIAEVKAQAVEEAKKAIAANYGLDNVESLDNIFGNGQKYDILRGEYDTQSKQYNELKAENALLRSGIPQNRWDDVRAVLQYTNQEVTPESIAMAKATHPEWTNVADVSEQKPQEMKEEPKPEVKPSIVTKFGGEPQQKLVEDEQSQALKLFGL